MKFKFRVSYVIENRYGVTYGSESFGTLADARKRRDSLVGSELIKVKGVSIKLQSCELR